MDARYEIFVSSTFEDLKEERRMLQERIMRLGHIPVGMELFDPGYAPQWEVITRAIDAADYYVLILADRYGSIAADGVGYTEKEFRYAVAHRKPILAFVLHESGREAWGRPDDPPSEAKRERLEAFRRELYAGGLLVLWQSSRQLELLMAEQLPRFIERHPRPGWVRGGVVQRLGRERDVLAALVGELCPYPSARPTSTFVSGSLAPLAGMSRFDQALRCVLGEYVLQFVEPGVRAYLACATGADTAAATYRLAISLEKVPAADVLDPDGYDVRPWLEGLAVGRPSNVDNVMRRGEIIPVRDASRPASGRYANQVVEVDGQAAEGSNLGLPIFHGSGPRRREVVAVAGLSSPGVGHVTDAAHHELAQRLVLLLSAFFDAFTASRARERPDWRGDDTAALLRRELADYYALVYGAVAAPPIPAAEV